MLLLFSSTLIYTVIKLNATSLYEIINLFNHCSKFPNSSSTKRKNSITQT